MCQKVSSFLHNYTAVNSSSEPGKVLEHRTVSEQSTQTTASLSVPAAAQLSRAAEGQTRAMMLEAAALQSLAKHPHGTEPALSQK